MDFSASVKLTMPDPRQQYFAMYNVDDVLIGKITGAKVFEAKDGPSRLKFYVNVNDQITVLCTARKGITAVPATGDTVRIQIQKKFHDTAQFAGEIIDYNPHQ